MLDLNKPVQLSTGEKARIICSDRKLNDVAGAPIIALVENSSGVEDLYYFRPDGWQFGAITGRRRLVNAPLEVPLPERHDTKLKVAVLRQIMSTEQLQAAAGAISRSTASFLKSDIQYPDAVIKARSEAYYLFRGALGEHRTS